MDISQLPNAFLIIESSKIFIIEKFITVIGRLPSNDLVLSDSHVSRQHAELRFSQGRFYLKDLDSTGGTFVNEKKISECCLFPGDVITLANVNLVFGQEELPGDDVTDGYDISSEEEQQQKSTDFLI
ncbi:MAG: hypothetical protein B6I38_01215 [Anaerolineaceae bacterium 4572_5.1]|nr:MAG: hypothetical protein B6I38_01215 [Anaerolineaceae bacterium 4572_5.1]RLD10247.1 MAG: hypothetical protein DRI56_03025 [Chloroflexota bacterium]